MTRSRRAQSIVVLLTLAANLPFIIGVSLMTMSSDSFANEVLTAHWAGVEHY